MLRCAVLALLAVAAIAGLAVAVFPASGVTRWLTVQPVSAQAIAFPVPLGIVAGMLATTALIWAIRTRRRRLGRTGVGMAVICAVAAGVLIVGPLLPRSSVPVSDGDRVISVVTWNTADRLREQDLVGVFVELDPDILVLPETTASTVERILERHPAGSVLPGGSTIPDLQVFTSASTGGIAPTTVLVSRSLGEYRQLPEEVVPDLALGVVGLEPVSDPGLPVIWGVHPPPPVPGLMDAWRSELQVSTELAGCHQPRDGGDGAVAALASGIGPHRGVITAGDLNATLRHGSLAGRAHCTDAVDTVASGAAGTWPASWPEWLGSPIDHVLVSGPLAPVSAELHRIGSSDHRAVSALIRLD